MIIVRLKGGLGNQLFQYAAGRRLAHANGTKLKLDLSAYQNDPLRVYELHPFQIQEELAAPEEIARLRGAGLARQIRRVAKSVYPGFYPTWVKERSLHFDPGLLDISGEAYLEGYWQSERYFQDIAPILHSEFTVRDPLEGHNRVVAETILGCPAVSIHVRRGDYVSRPETFQTHGVCPPEYYREAAAELAGEVRDAHFFVFSDEPEWAQENLRLEHPVTYIVGNRPQKGYEDLRLLSLCRHHIIANSSFSWWGAWLSRCPEKIVIAPRQWFADPRNDTRDLIPPSWRRR